MDCDASCACAGQMSASQCELFPGCDQCLRVERVLVGLAHVVAYDPARGVALVHVHPGETLHDVVRREVPEEERPRWMN